MATWATNISPPIPNASVRTGWRRGTPAKPGCCRAKTNTWGATPAIKRVLIKHVAEAGTQRLMLGQGDVDVARDLTPEDLKDFETSKDVTIAKVLKPQLFFWTFNVTEGPFANEKVRLAMRYLIDYDGLAKTVMTNLGVPR